MYVYVYAASTSVAGSQDVCMCEHRKLLYGMSFTCIGGNLDIAKLD